LAIEAAIEHGGGDFGQIVNIIRSNGSVEYARECAMVQVQRAQSSASKLRPSAFRTCLLDLASFALGRDR
jgi:octaprenyl-diphosphate synthase